jgi:beta-glucosidase
MAKVALRAGESREIVIPLNARAFHVWDPAADRWITPAGKFTVAVGRSSREFAAALDLAPRVGTAR